MMNAVAASKYDRPFIIETDGYTSTFIYSKTKKESKPFPAKEWFSSITKHFGSSMEGRIHSFRFLTNSKQKSAILISEISQCIYFPLKGNTSMKNVWILYHTVKDFRAFGNKKTLLFFKDDLVYETNVDYRTIKEQMKRCETYINHLNMNHHNEGINY